MAERNRMSESDLQSPASDRVPIADTPARSDYAPIADTPARASVSTNVMLVTGPPASRHGARRLVGGRRKVTSQLSWQSHVQDLNSITFVDTDARAGVSAIGA